MVRLVTKDDDGNMVCQGSGTRALNQSKPEPQTSRITDINERKNNLVNNSAQNNIMNNLPRIDGISYQQQKAKDGTVYVTATGSIHNKNSILKEACFKWNARRKIWWKTA